MKKINDIGEYIESEFIKKEQQNIYISVKILYEVIEQSIENGFTILGWEAIIFTSKGTLSPVDLIIGTGPEEDGISRNNNALHRDYGYFINNVINGCFLGKYNLKDVYIDFVLQK